MKLFLWICIIAICLLFVYMLLIYLTCKKKKNLKPPVLISILATEFIFCITLCVATVLQGTKITNSKLITSLQIDERTFQKTTDQTQGYQFTTTDGIEFQISDEELLDTVVPSKPQTVEIYQCNTYDGFSWCYISKSDGVYYKIK